MSATSRIEATQRVREQPPDAIIIDWEFLGRSGPELVREWSHDPVLMWVPVLLVLSSATGDELSRALDHGAWDFVRAPIEPIELATRVRNAIQVKHYQDAIRKESVQDALTELPNRKAFRERYIGEFKRAVRYSRDLSLIIVDFDDFRGINDRYGHDVGDRVLIGFGRHLHDTLRASDVVARWGADEFAILLPETPLENAAEVIHRIRERNAASIGFPANASERVSFCAGVAGVARGRFQSPEELFKIAEEEVAAAKRAGRDSISAFGIGLIPRNSDRAEEAA